MPAFGAALRVRNWPMRRKVVALLAAASLVPLSLAAVFEVREARSELHDNAAELLAARADQLRRQIDALHLGYQRPTIKLARLPALVMQLRRLGSGGGGHADAARAIRETLDVHTASDRNLLAIAVLDHTGRVVVATAPRLVGKVLASRGYLRGAPSDMPAISELHLSEPELDEVPAIAYSAVVGDGAQPIGAVVLWLRASALWELVRGSNELAGPASFAVVVDRDGIRIAHTFDDSVVFRPVAPVAPAVAEALVAERRFGPDTGGRLADVLPFPELGERARAPVPDPRMFRGYAPAIHTSAYGMGRRLSTKPWTVFYLHAEREIDHRIEDLVRHRLMLVALIGLGTLVIGLVLAARILRPIGSLSAATARIRAGDLSARVPILAGGDELGRLCDSFNEMADRIQRDDAELRRSRDELEQRVAERTKELVQASVTEAAARAALEASTARLESLSRTAHELAAASGDIADVLELAARRMGEIIGEYCAIRLVSEDGKWLEPTAAFYARDPARREIIGQVLRSTRAPIGKGVGGRVAQNGQARLIPEITSAQLTALWKVPPAYVPLLEQVGVASVLTIPLRSRDRTIGVVTLLRSRQGGPYSVDDQRFAQDVADRAGLAIDNATLVATLERRVRARTAALEAANQELEAFSYSVSHDLRAPLRAIDGFSEALLSDHAAQLDDQGKEYLQRVRTATHRMGGLIDDLLQLARITRAQLRWSSVDLTAIANQLAGELRRRDPERTTPIHVAPGVMVRGDARLLAIALENLLGNAWKFTAKHPAAEIWFEQQQRDGRAVFCVRDSGAGFDMKYADKLFVPFARLHAASDYEGVGVGLATVQRIVSRHGGTIWGEGAPGRGAAFFFTLGTPGTLDELA